MTDDSSRPALRAASWFALLVAVLATLVPYCEMTLWLRMTAEMIDAFDAELPAALQALLSVPPWVSTTAAMSVVIALVLKEAVMSDVVARLGLNLAAATTMLVVAYLISVIRVLPLMGLVNKLGPNP